MNVSNHVIHALHYYHNISRTSCVGKLMRTKHFTRPLMMVKTFCRISVLLEHLCHLNCSHIFRHQCSGEIQLFVFAVTSGL